VRLECLQRKVIEMTSDPDGGSYKRRVQLFAQQYCEKHNQRKFHIETGVPESTISQSLYKENGFGPGNHRKIVQWIEKVATDLYERELPLVVDDIELPLEPEFLRRLGVCAETVQDTQGEAAPGTEETPQTNDSPSEEPPVDGHDNHGADETEVIVPQGVSITLPELRGKAAELWNRADLFGNDQVSEDLEKVFAISRKTMADTEDANAGWIGPSPPEDLDFQLDEKMYDQLDGLLEHWKRHAFAYEITRDVPRFAEHFAFLYIRRRMLEIEVVLIKKFWLTHPEAEIPWQDFQRLRELEWRYELILQLQRVEYHTNLEVLVAASIWVGKTTFVAPLKGAIRLFGRLFRRSQRNVANR